MARRVCMDSTNKWLYCSIHMYAVFPFQVGIQGKDVRIYHNIMPLKREYPTKTPRVFLVNYEPCNTLSKIILISYCRYVPGP